MCMRRVGSAFALATGAFVALASTALASTVPLQQISSDPFTNTTSFHKTEVEPDTFAFGSTIVATFQVGRFRNGGASDIGWATSQDGGASWTHGFLRRITLYTQPAGSFPRVTHRALRS